MLDFQNYSKMIKIFIAYQIIIKPMEVSKLLK